MTHTSYWHAVNLQICVLLCRSATNPSLSINLPLFSPMPRWYHQTACVSRPTLKNKHQSWCQTRASSILDNPNYLCLAYNKKEPRVSHVYNMRKTSLQRVFCGPKMTQRLLKATIHRTITAPGLSEFLPSPGVTGLSWASPPIVVEKAGCAGAQASLALLCSWGIWHAKQPDGSLSLFLWLSLTLLALC